MDLFELADAAPRTYAWHWWDPLPSGCSDREALLIQIKRDRRAFGETGDAFYAERAESYREGLKEMR